MTQSSATAFYRVFDRRLRAPAGLPLVLDAAHASAAIDAPTELCRDEAPPAAPPPGGHLLHDVQDFEHGPHLRLWRQCAGFRVDYDRWSLRWRAQSSTLYYSQEADFQHEGSQYDHFRFALAMERVFLPLYLLLESEDMLGLHGSAVTWQGRAYLFIGRSGAGKSTTAYELMRRGARLLTDDLTLVEPGRMEILGAAPAVRLWRQAGALPEALEDRGIWPHEQSKRWFRMPDSQAAPQRAPLGAIIWLDPDGPHHAGVPQTQSSSLAGRDALVELLRQTFDLSHPEHDWMRARFRAASQLVHACPMYRFSYQKSPDGEPRHVDALFRAIRAWHAQSIDVQGSAEAT